jgi:hypothetical protein
MGNIVFARGVSHRKGSGTVKNGEKPFGTIPTGYRPSEATYVTVNGSSANRANIQINPDGTITVKGEPGGTSSTANPYIVLDGAWWSIN